MVKLFEKACDECKARDKGLWCVEYMEGRRTILCHECFGWFIDHLDPMEPRLDMRAKYIRNFTGIPFDSKWVDVDLSFLDIQDEIKQAAVLAKHGLL